MPSKKQYDLVSDDGLDSRIPLYNDTAFRHGLHFHTKYIGSLDVPRPNSRVEIVAAMRRIRYEFRAKAVMKKKVKMTVSVDGIRIQLKKKPRKATWDEDPSVLMSHPVHRIFYVSHDSQDLKIFSFIARDGATSVFRCNVFKAYKKSDALRIVRTIGQAFDVCHKLTLQGAARKNVVSGVANEKSSGDGAKLDKVRMSKELKNAVITASPQSGDTTDTSLSEQQRVCVTSVRGQPTDMSPSSDCVTVYHQIELLRQQLQLQHDETHAAVTEVALLKEQLGVETAARIQVQRQTRELLDRNRCLLQHIGCLVAQLDQTNGMSPVDLSYGANLCPLPAVTTPQCGVTPYVHDSCGWSAEMTESPDSGHREMSSECLCCGECSLPSDSTYLCGHARTEGGDMHTVTRQVFTGDSVDITTPTACNSGSDELHKDMLASFKGRDRLRIAQTCKVDSSDSLRLSSKATYASDKRICEIKPVVRTDETCADKVTRLPVAKPPGRNLFIQVQSFYKDIRQKRSLRDSRRPHKDSDVVSSKNSQNPENLQRCKGSDEIENYVKTAQQNGDIGSPHLGSMLAETKCYLRRDDLAPKGSGTVEVMGDMNVDAGDSGKSRTEDTALLLPAPLNGCVAFK